MTLTEVSPVVSVQLICNPWPGRQRISFDNLILLPLAKEMAENINLHGMLSFPHFSLQKPLFPMKIVNLFVFTLQYIFKSQHLHVSFHF